jgi:amino acid transporter
MEEVKGGEFRRVLGPWSTSALIAGCIIGTGIFFFVSDVAVRLPSRTAILAAWVVGAAIASCGALSLAELAAAYPQTGGIYVFLCRAFGPFVGFLYSWAKFLIMQVGTFAILAVAFSGFFADFLGLDPESSGEVKKAVSIGVIIILTGINIAGLRGGATVQNVLTALKILCLLAIVGIGAAFALGLLTSHLVAVKPAPQAEGSFLLLFGAALIPTMWTFGGWEESPFVAEEVRNPERNLPLSILGGLWTVAVLYVLVNAAYLAILSPAEMAGTAGATATVAMERALGGGARRLLNVALMLSTIGAANGFALTGGRIAYAVGRDQALLRWFAHTHPGTKTPVRGLAVQGILVILAILALENPFTLLLYTGMAYWGFAALTGMAVMVLRRRDPLRKRPFRVWAYPLTPILFIAAALGMAVSVIAADVNNKTRNGLAAAIILAVGAIVYGIQRLAFRDRSRSAAPASADLS